MKITTSPSFYPPTFYPGVTLHIGMLGLTDKPEPRPSTMIRGTAEKVLEQVRADKLAAQQRSEPANVFTPEQAIQAITNLLTGYHPQVRDRILSVIDRTDLPHPDSTDEPHADSPSELQKCGCCGYRWHTGTNGSHSCLDTLRQRASKGFATCQSGKGQPKIVIEFRDLHSCQKCYETLVLMWGGEYQLPVSLTENQQPSTDPSPPNA
jgi:hypothetical protein